VTYRLGMKLAFVFVLIACGRSTSAPPPTTTPPANSGECTAGQAKFTHGCGGGPAFATGCYTRCDDADCPGGTTCTQVTIDPCAGKECDACGAEAKLCL
jgi:hypothetical protein